MLALLAVAAPTYLPTDPRIVLVGRFDRSHPASVACQWPASEIRLKLKGASFTVTIEEKGRDVWQVVVDGELTEVLTPIPGVASYTVTLGADAIHDVSLVKRTESFVGTTRFRGFQIPKGGLFQAHRHSRTIEFVGDSITCGYGNEGTSEKSHFSIETENAYATYAAIAAREMNADLRVLAWSGRKMWPDNTMPEILDRVLPTQPMPVAMDEIPPVAVVINLATNDFATGNPPEGPWTGAYAAFVRRRRVQYPDAHVYVTLGGMMKDDYPAGHKALTTARRYLSAMVQRIKDPKVHFLEFDQQHYEDGIGADWHPNLVTHRKMASRLVEAMRRDLGW